jgi:hypothetical protein
LQAAEIVKILRKKFFLAQDLLSAILAVFFGTRFAVPAILAVRGSNLPFWQSRLA